MERLSHVSIISTSILSVAIVPFLSLRSLCLLSSETWVWAYSWRSCISLTLRERSSIILTCTSLFFRWTRRVRVRIRLYQSIHVLAPFFGRTHRDSVRIRTYHSHVGIADRIYRSSPHATTNGTGAIRYTDADFFCVLMLLLDLGIMAGHPPKPPHIASVVQPLQLSTYYRALVEVFHHCATTKPETSPQYSWLKSATMSKWSLNYKWSPRRLSPVEVQTPRMVPGWMWLPVVFGEEDMRGHS